MRRWEWKSRKNIRKSRGVSNFKRKALQGKDAQKNTQHNEEKINLATNGYQISSEEEVETNSFENKVEGEADRADYNTQKKMKN